MIDRYGLPRADPGERYYRTAIWMRAIDHGCDSEDIARAYGVTRDAVTSAVRRYRKAYGKPEQGQGVEA